MTKIPVLAILAIITIGVERLARFMLALVMILFCGVFFGFASKELFHVLRRPAKSRAAA